MCLSEKSDVLQLQAANLYTFYLVHKIFVVWDVGLGFLVFFFVSLKTIPLLSYATSVRPFVHLSSVEIISFPGNLISNMLIDLKFGLNVGYGIVHVRVAWFFKILIASCKFMQFTIFCKYICVHGFDWCTNWILLKIDIHVRYTMMHVWNNWFFFQNLHIYANYFFLQMDLCTRFCWNIINMYVLRCCKSKIIVFFTNYYL